MTATAIGGRYLRVDLNSGRSRTRRSVHILVAEAFLGTRPAKKEVNHRDGNRFNNHVNNLEWVSHSENMQHAAALGLRDNAYKRGDMHWTRRYPERLLRGEAWHAARSS